MEGKGHVSRFTSLLALTVIANTGMGIIMPVLPVFLKQHGLSAVELSGPFVMLVAGRMVSRAFAPSLIAKVGHRRAVMACFAIYAATFATYLGAQSLTVFSGLRFLEGIVEGLLAVALNDLAIAYTQGMEPTRRTQLMGRFGSAFGLGFLLGPLLGSAVAWLFGLQAIFVAGAVLGVGAIMLAAWMVVDAPASRAQGPAPAHLAGFSGMGLLIGLYSPQSLRRVVFFSLMILLPLHVTEQLGLRAESAGLFFAVSAVLTTTLMPMAARWAQRVGMQRAVWSGLLVMTITIAVLGMTRNAPLFWTLFVIETVAFALMLPPSMTIFSGAVDNQAARTRILGNMAFVTELVSLPLAGLLPWCYARGPAYAWAVVAFMCLLALALFLASGRALARQRGAESGTDAQSAKASQA